MPEIAAIKHPNLTHQHRSKKDIISPKIFMFLA